MPPGDACPVGTAAGSGERDREVEVGVVERRGQADGVGGDDQCDHADRKKGELQTLLAVASTESGAGIAILDLDTHARTALSRVPGSSGHARDSKVGKSAIQYHVAICAMNIVCLRYRGGGHPLGRDFQSQGGDGRFLNIGEWPR